MCGSGFTCHGGGWSAVILSEGVNYCRGGAGSSSWRCPVMVVIIVRSSWSSSYMWLVIVVVTKGGGVCGCVCVNNDLLDTIVKR